MILKAIGLVFCVLLTLAAIWGFLILVTLASLGKFFLDSLKGRWR